MWKCKNCLIVFLLQLLVIHSSEAKPRFLEINLRRIREATNSSVKTIAKLPLFLPMIPNINESTKCAVNTTFCENSDSYPYTHIKYILENNFTFVNIFTKNYEKEREELVNRHSPVELYLCRSISKTVFPKIGKNKSNKWKFIVNQENFLQGVRIETCYRPDAPCDILGDIPSGYTTFCRQKYIYSKLLSLNDRGYPAPDTFQLPSACCCAYKRNIYFLREFGVQFSSVTTRQLLNIKAEP